MIENVEKIKGTTSRNSFFCMLVFFLLVSPYSWSQGASNSYGWGGGGAFTGYIDYAGSEYVSSDVTGIWKKTHGEWVPFVNGLTNYNVTTLTTFNDKLVAITTDEVLVTNGREPWSPIDLKVSTYRGVTDSPVAFVNSWMCIANRETSIQCVDKAFSAVTIDTPLEKIKGIFTAIGSTEVLYVYGGKKIYVVNLSSKKVSLVSEYPSNVGTMVALDDKVWAVTKKAILGVGGEAETSLYEAKSGQLVNAFSGVSKSGDTLLYIGQGNRWSQKLYAFTYSEGKLEKIGKIKVEMDADLPHRRFQKGFTKFLGVYSKAHELWLTDYWGVYQLASNQSNVLQEITQNAVNTVATDLVLTPDNFFISTMDVGVVRISRQSEESELLTPYSMRGHAWSMLETPQSIIAVFSPWNKPNDYLLDYSKESNETSFRPITKYESRSSKGAFWGQAYSRSLFDFNGIGSVRDGQDGGIVFDENHKPSMVGKENRVFRAAVTHNDSLYVAACDGNSGVYQFDKELKEQNFYKFSNYFCPFNVFENDDALYFLGSANKHSVIYKLDDSGLAELFRTKKGSAFYAMSSVPGNPDRLIAATTTWSNKATSALYVSTDGGESFHDKSCLLSHRNGVVKIVMDNEKETYIQQKVGGGLKLENETLFSDKSCS